MCLQIGCDSAMGCGVKHLYAFFDECCLTVYLQGLGPDLIC